MNQLTEVKKNNVLIAKYYYDHAGLRYKKIDYVTAKTTIYVYGQGYEPIYEEIYSNGNLSTPTSKVSYLNMGNRRIARVEDGVIKYYYTDHLGSPRIVLDAGTTGTSVGSMTILESEPFGADFGAESTERYKFTGKEDDGETGLQYFNARYYDPAIGRFMSEDPAKDGVNWYVYVANSPLKFVDPTGLWIQSDEGNWVAEEGDTLWGLSEIIFGDGARWEELGYEGDARLLQVDATIVDLGKGWIGRVDNPHVPGDKKHAHYKKNGEEVWNENEDGTPHHRNKQTEAPSKKIKEKMKEKTGWDPKIEPSEIATGVLIGYLAYQGLKYTVAVTGAPMTGGSSLFLILVP